MSDRIIVMNEGITMQDGTPNQIYHEPLNRFVADFIGSANFLSISRQGDRWTLADGTPLSINTDSDRFGDAPVSALLRPEAIEIESATSPQPSPLLNRLTGTVISSIFLGQHIEYLIGVAGVELRVFSRNLLPVGSSASVTFLARDCRLVANDAVVPSPTH